MLSKPQINLLYSLRLKKYRGQHGLFIVEGEKIVKDLLNSGIKVEHVYTVESKVAYIPASIPHTAVTENELKKISSLVTPQGILAVSKIPDYSKAEPDLKKELSIVLDNIRDPGNLGTIMRIADWFGICHIYCSEECVDAYNPKVVQASMGSVAKIKVHYINLLPFLSSKASSGINIYGASLGGKNIYKEGHIGANGLLVIGNESHGISEHVRRFITCPVSIPSYNPNGPESLNAAIATAVLCAEIKRRQHVEKLP